MGREPPAPTAHPTPAFSPRVVRVGRAFCAIDYAISNCTAVQVEGGYVLIDTGPGVAAGAAIRAALEKHVQGDLLGIIYTHAHADHTHGGSAFWRPGVPIWAHERFHEEMRDSRKFTQALVWPVLSYVAAIFVIAAMVLVLGLIAPADGKGFDALGLGLMGPSGAVIWLAVSGGFTAAVVVAFLYVKGNDRLRAKGEALALRIPGLAGCFRAFALQRFSLGLHMTGEAGLKADKALLLSFRATSNEAYTRHGESASKAARDGNKIAPTLAACGEALFPVEFLDTIGIGETTGRLPDVMAKQAKQYQEEAARKMKLLAMIAGGLVYAAVGFMLIVLIVRILMSIGGVYQDAMKGL